jgi:hypothetical protein
MPKTISASPTGHKSPAAHERVLTHSAAQNTAVVVISENTPRARSHGGPENAPVTVARSGEYSIARRCPHIRKGRWPVRPFFLIPRELRTEW